MALVVNDETCFTKQQLHYSKVTFQIVSLYKWLLPDQTNLTPTPSTLYIEFCPPNFTMLTMASSWRGCASSFKQPMSKKDEYEAECLRGTIYRKNCEDNSGKRPQVKDVIYRTGDGDSDILRHVFRWEMAPYQEVFRNGLRVKRDTSSTTRPDDDTYFSLLDYVSKNGEGIMGLESRVASKWAYISTTISNSWFPPTVNVGSSSSSVELYRYEIYAPGGIWLALTLGDLATTTPTVGHHQVVFPIGIASQYIRSVQIFNLILLPNSNGTTKIERVKKEVIINGNFNPQSHPLKLLKVEDPVCDYVVDENTRAPLKSTVYHPDDEGKNANLLSPITEWYKDGVIKVMSYVDEAFRTSTLNTAYYFLKNVSILVDYAPGTGNDKFLEGPMYTVDMFPFLKGTPFAEHRIDCAFGSHDDNQAYIFSANLCALITYSTDDGNVNSKILKGPMPIIEMFSCLKGTVFEDGIGTAIEGTRDDVILLKGDQCARILYKIDELVELGAVAGVFSSLNGHILETNIDGAHASHVAEEGSYVYKGDRFAYFYFGPGPDKIGDDGQIYKIGAQAQAMSNLYHFNRGLDFIPSDLQGPAPT